MAEVTYTLVCNGKEYGTITRSDLNKGVLWARIGPNLYMAAVKANRHATELFYDHKTGDWFDSHERSQSFIQLLKALSDAITSIED